MKSLIVDFAMDTMTAMPAPPAQFNNSVVGTASASFGQGNLLKGIDNKNITKWGYRRLHPLNTYVSFSVTKWFKIAGAFFPKFIF